MLLDPVTRLELANATHRSRIQTAARHRLVSARQRSRRTTHRITWARARHQ